MGVRLVQNVHPDILTSVFGPEGAHSLERAIYRQRHFIVRS
jgi:hypothetical protein